jgi:hypothetical protein
LSYILREIRVFQIAEKGKHKPCGESPCVARLPSGFQLGRAAERQSRTAMMPAASFSHMRSACPFPTPGAAERHSRDATPGRFHMCEVHASFPYRVRQSHEAAMLPRASSHACAKRVPFAHIGCGRAAKPRLPPRVTFPCLRAARAPGAAERRSCAAAPGFFQRTKHVPWCPPGWVRLVLYIKKAWSIANSGKGKHKLYLIGVFEIPKMVSINHVDKVHA